MRCPCGSERLIKNGGGRMRCRDCGKSPRASAEDVLEVRQGLAPEHGLTEPMPAGYLMGKVTVQRGPGGVERTWTRMSPDLDATHAAILAAIDALAADLPRVEPRPAKGVWRTDLLTAYPIGDPHIGMYSWAAAFTPTPQFSMTTLCMKTLFIPVTLSTCMWLILYDGIWCI